MTHGSHQYFRLALAIISWYAINSGTRSSWCGASNTAIYRPKHCSQVARSGIVLHVGARSAACRTTICPSPAGGFSPWQGEVLRNLWTHCCGSCRSFSWGVPVHLDQRRLNSAESERCPPLPPLHCRCLYLPCYSCCLPSGLSAATREGKETQRCQLLCRVEIACSSPTKLGQEGGGGGGRGFERV